MTVVPLPSPVPEHAEDTFDPTANEAAYLLACDAVMRALSDAMDHVMTGERGPTTIAAFVKGEAFFVVTNREVKVLAVPADTPADAPGCYL